MMKSEPETFSIEDLAAQGESLWDGVRNFQARNFMMNAMSPGDPVLFYHSSADPSGVAGLAEVAGPAVPDPTQFKKSAGDAYDARATKAKPIWFCVPVRFVAAFDRIIPLSELRELKSLTGLAVLAKGQRLSILPVTAKHFARIAALGKS